MNENIKKMAEEVYEIGHTSGGCEGCPFENYECYFIRCSGSVATVESIAGQIERKYTESKDFVETIENYKPPIILDDIEKEYLKNVLAPWLKRKDNKIKITKENAFLGKEFWLSIDIYDKYEEDNNGFDLPTFYSKQMYAGMEVRKAYTVEELGLR